MLKRLGKYEIVEKIGQGAMGEVFRAHDPVLGRDVAVKTMAASLGADAEQRSRFQREAQSAGRLNHPNIITVYDFGEEQGQVYIAMELLEGEDLKDLAARGPAFSLQRTLDVMDQLCEGLAFAHAKGVVHRDLKPANVHVQPNGQVKIMDFGLARLNTSDMTRAGMIMGTPNYMSPEQVRGEKASARSDVFSLGVVFYELLAGRRAFDADSLHAVLFQVMQAEPPDLGGLRPDLPAPLLEVVRRAMHKDAAQRYADAAEMRDALRGARAAAGVAPLPGPARPPAGPGRPAFDATQAEPPRAETVALGAATVARPTGEATRVASATVAQAPPARGAAGRASSRAALAGGTALALVVAGLVAWRALRPSPPASPSPEPSPGLSVAPRPSAASSPQQSLSSGSPLVAARRAFEERDYAAAAQAAERVLAAHPQDAEAGRLLAEARRLQGDVARTAAQVRAALDAGDTERAEQQLPRLQQLDPRQAESFQARLRDMLSGRAQEARRVAESAQSALDAAHAALPEAEAGRRAMAQGDAALRGTQWAEAARRFSEAREAFGRARRTTLGGPAAPATPRPVVTPTPLPTAAPSAPPTPAPTPVATPTPGPPAQSDAAARQAVRGVLDEYRQAFENRNAEALRAVQPGVDYEAMRAEFARVKSYTLRLDVKAIAVSGATARAECVVTYQPNPSPAGKLPPVATTFHLKRTGDLWQIERLERR